MDIEIVKNKLLHHPLNHGIQFNEASHVYTRHFSDGSSETYNGVTSLIKEYSPFDAKGIKWGIVNSNKPEYAHLNTVDDVEAEWQAARDHGTEVHKLVENWGQYGEYVDRPELNQVIEFFQQSHLVPLAFEHVVYCDTLKRSTPIDIPMWDTTRNRIVIGDFKTSKEIKYDHYFDNGTPKKMEYPLTHLPTSNFWGYSLQIALPIDWLKNYYFFDGEIPIANYGYIFHIRDGKFTPHKTIPMQREVNMIYEWKK